jgi:predicted GNAT superfamily acetyltransferase
MFFKFRELASSRNIKYMYGNYDPLEGNLGHTYYNKLGFWGIRYQESAYELAAHDHPASDIPIDKVVVKWELDSQRTCEKLEGTYRGKRKMAEILTKQPVVNENNFEDSETVLVKIPEDFVSLKKMNPGEALNWRLNTRKIFKEYINNRGYWITEFYSEKKDGRRHNYYLLEKKRILNSDENIF